MGVDWRSIGWGEYQMLLAGWNAAHDTDKPKPVPSDPERLRRFKASHSVH